MRVVGCSGQGFILVPIMMIGHKLVEGELTRSSNWMVVPLSLDSA